MNVHRGRTRVAGPRRRARDFSRRRGQQGDVLLRGNQPVERRSKDDFAVHGSTPKPLRAWCDHDSHDGVRLRLVDDPTAFVGSEEHRVHRVQRH